MFLIYALIFGCLECTPAHSDLITVYEPIQYIKSQVSLLGNSSIWKELNEMDAQQVGQMTSLIKQRFHAVVESETSVIISKGERIIAKQLSSRMKMKVPIRIPYANLISLLSISITILLENYKFSLISKPIHDILKGDDLKNPLVEDYGSKSLLSILNSLPAHSQSADLAVHTKKLDEYGELASHFINSVLGNTAREAWMDALLAVGIETDSIDPRNLMLTLKSILQYAVAVTHDFQALDKATKLDDISLQSEKYLFGWWINCPSISNKCIFPELPEDLIFTVHPTLRIYISPKLELSLIILNTKSELSSVDDIVNTDKGIWMYIYSSLIEVGHVSKREENVDSSPVIVRLIHQVWPVLVFVFWVVSSHIWVYWLFHCCWFIATSFSKRTHTPRP